MYSRPRGDCSLIFVLTDGYFNVSPFVLLHGCFNVSPFVLVLLHGCFNVSPFVLLHGYFYCD